MPLVRRAGQHRARARAEIPAAREAEQAAAEEVRREVLLRDGDLAPLPAVAELAQERQHDALEHGGERVVGEQAVERGLCGRVVERLQRAPQLGRGRRRGRRASRPAAGGSSQRLPRRFGGGQPGAEQLAASARPGRRPRRSRAGSRTRCASASSRP